MESPTGAGAATTLDCKNYALEHGFDPLDDRVVFAIDPQGKSSDFYNNSGSSMSVLSNRFSEIVHKEVFDKAAIINWHIEYELDLMYEALGLLE